jgi:hypothetical protein
MDIFESLETLNVSEECFNDIVGLVEEYLSEGVNINNVVDRAKENLYDDVLKNALHVNDISKNNKRRLEIFRKRGNGDLSDGIENLVKDTGDADIPDSEAHIRNHISGNSCMDKATTNFTRGAEEDAALSIKGGDRRQANKSIGRYYRK